MSKAKENKYNLTEGSILDKLLLVALPIMGTQIVQMAYNLTDMFWLGRVGSTAVAASGTVGMFMWLGQALLMYGRMGSEIGVSQNLGRGDEAAARDYGQTALTIGAILGIFYAVFLVVFRTPLLGFFKIQEAEVVADAMSYLVLVSIGIPFSYVSSAVTGIFNGSGNARIPFYINAVGLIVNIILDPIMILTMNMGIAGAAIATVIAQIIACVLSIWALKRHEARPFEDFSLFKIGRRNVLMQIIRWATPIAVESFLFTFLSMFISRFVAAWGSGAMATQRIGSQIESMSWLISGGFSSALTSYIGQNFGASKWSRIQRGFNISLCIMAVWGVIVTLIMYFGGGFIFAMFLPGEPEVIALGVDYLKILAVVQLISCLESISAGAFRGLGKTMQPSVVSGTVNFMRVILAYYLSQSMGLNGIWWGVSIGMAVRGIWMFIWYMSFSKKLPKEDGVLKEAI
ncbi:MATE family efflux transporter [Tyzzerella sp. OttesenSCG-928-J15]|nr:MATE family efflux transporter [Tyzzerella sp. OttesenSCG-928-J15]